MWVFARNAVLCAVTLLTWAGVAMAQGCDDRFPRTCPGYFPPFPESGRGARLPAPPRVILPPPARMPEDGGRQPGLYAPLGDEPFPVPPVDLSQIEPRFLRRVVPYPTSEPPGTIIIDPQAHYLYLVQDGGMAIRYGVGVGRQGFSWSGTATVHEKREWPDWYPPKEMIERQPEIRRQLTQLQSGVGVPGGLRNPLGARALYLWQGNKDTLYRIHGTNEPWTIGRSVSSGCIRMINQDVIDLYDRVPIGAKVVVLGGGPRFGADHETAPRRAAAR